MRVLVVVKASNESETGKINPDELKKMGQFNDELLKAGVMQAAEGLHPSAKGKRVRFSGAQRTVVNGPFPNAKELVAGFWIWKVRSVDEAVDWIKKAPFDGGAEVEIRPIMELEELDDVMTPEVKAQEERQRAAMARNH